MKKLIALALAVSLMLCAMPALAAGRLNVLQENFHVVDAWSTYAYAFAKVENSGDRPIKVNAGVLELYDAEGEVIATSDYVYSHVTYLQPGEYTYVQMYKDLEKDDPRPDDYMMTLTGKSDKSTVALHLPVTPQLVIGLEEGYWTRNYMYATVTNDTATPLYNIELVFALQDAEGNILFLESKDMYGEMALLPGSSMIIRKEISSTFMDYFEANGIVPASVDVIAYVLQEVE